MRRMLWRPLVLGIALGILDFSSLAVDFLIPLGPFGATGPQEILLTMSAALGGPLGALVASLMHEFGIYLYFLRTQFPPEQALITGVLFALADLAAHLAALLTVAYGYRFLNQRAKKAIFFAGWSLIVIVYYFLLVLLQSFLIGLVVAERHPLTELFQNNLPEFLVTLIVTTLVWFALPARFARPLWHEPKQEPEPTDRDPKRTPSSIW